MNVAGILLICLECGERYEITAREVVLCSDGESFLVRVPLTKLPCLKCGAIEPLDNGLVADYKTRWVPREILRGLTPTGLASRPALPLPNPSDLT